MILKKTGGHPGKSLFFIISTTSFSGLKGFKNLSFNRVKDSREERYLKATYVCRTQRVLDKKKLWFAIAHRCLLVNKMFLLENRCFPGFSLHNTSYISWKTNSCMQNTLYVPEKGFFVWRKLYVFPGKVLCVCQRLHTFLGQRLFVCRILHTLSRKRNTTMQNTSCFSLK